MAAKASGSNGSNKNAAAPARSTSTFTVEDPYEYLNGLNNYHEYESVPGTLPIGHSHPQQVKGLLYPERLSGSAFTVSRKESKQTTFYRTLPSTSIGDFEEYKSPKGFADFGLSDLTHTPQPTIWLPVDIEKDDDFVSGLKLVAGAGDPAMKKGIAYYFFSAGKDMPEDHAFTSSDGDLLIIPQQGSLDIKTEMGPIRVRPGELCVLPRGVRFHVSLLEGPARGYIMETFMNHFELPELGPLGSVGMAHARDFQVPKLQPYRSGPDTKIIQKYNGKLFVSVFKGTIFNVVAWHGSYYPYKYDMGRFNHMGSVSFDHADPSIFCALSVKGEVEGAPAADVCVISARWEVSEDTFRPAYAHRNIASEFMAYIKGKHEGKEMSPEERGISSLHNGMTPHGPGRQAWDKGISSEIAPLKIGNGNLAIMWESCYNLGLSEWANSTNLKTFPKGRYGEFEDAVPA